ncbi:MAG: 4Fe-4S binding protein [Gammaproteobacteria bacterium]|nr:4Fe-4S binding protein [Gammaproteobacteria bacterium]
MMHPGLPDFWAYLVWGFMLVLLGRIFIIKKPIAVSTKHINLADINALKPLVRLLTTSSWPLLFLKIVVISLFILVIVAGLKGTPIPERNIATVLTWNIWWAGLIVSIFFLGSSWCAVCPWDALASWLVKPRFWVSKKMNNSMEITPPKWLRSVWPAVFMFIGLTWLELGAGITTSPYGTAVLSLLMVVLATLSLAIFKNKAFCHYICPVGRTVGFYAQLAPIELRAIDPDVCASCTSLECFHGSEQIDSCPTQLVMGQLNQNTYCTSCGNCVQSCPEKNVFWRLRPQSYEAMQGARPHWDEAWFMLALLALTSFHGITMMEFWENWIRQLGQALGDSGQLLMSFSVGFALSLLLPVLIYSLAVWLTRAFSRKKIKYTKLFTGLVFVTLPLAFAYHLAHNLNHMIRESVGASQIFLNPLGRGALPVSFSENILKDYQMLISQDVLFALQALLMMFGFWIALKVLRYRGYSLLGNAGWNLSPMLFYLIAINGFHLWMLTQPMLMRMGALCVAP